MDGLQDPPPLVIMNHASISAVIVNQIDKSEEDEAGDRCMHDVDQTGMLSSCLVKIYAGSLRFEHVTLTTVTGYVVN
jgi:hypothetical protein